MAQKVITGYTGTRHISPGMDAAVWRGIFGEESCILKSGGNCAGSMPSINEFVIQDGVVSIQGYLGYGTHESLTIDTCTTGYKRIDLICARYTHDTGSLIDATEYVVIKGTEVTGTPAVPAYNSGSIAAGATIVDFPMYQVDLDGPNVTFTQLAKVKGIGEILTAGTNISINNGIISAIDTTTYGGTLPSGTNLYEIRTENKVYLCSGSNTYTNLPTGAAYGSLVVEKSSPGTQSTIVQRFSNISKAWFRMYINSRWYPWVDVSKDENTEYEGISPIVISGTEISHADSGATAGTYGSWTTEDVTPSFGGTFYVPSFKVNAKGHVTAGQHHKVKIPNAGASSTAAGLMSAADKIKLDSMSWYDATISVGTLNAGAAKTDQTYTIPTSVLPSNKTTIALSGFYLSGTGYQDCSITRIHLAGRTVGWTVANHGTVSRSGLSLVVRFLAMTM